ncbi:MAG: hypothetical protein ACXVCY_11535 [Pseudobdellovibrionaceae bacterium]
MKWFQKVLTAIATVNLVVSPVLAADSMTPGQVFYNSPDAKKYNSFSIDITTKVNGVSDKEKAQLNQYENILEELGYRLELDQNAKKVLVYDKDNSLFMEIPFGEEGQLRKFSPKSLNRMLLDEMVRLKTSVGASSKAAWSHSVKNMAPESLIFFAAMGAVVAGQLILNYSQNPVAMQQHIEHSISPLGIFGFFTFMYTQGLTSNVLAMYMKNPRFHHWIPYLGMSVGSFMQSYLSQLISDPDVLLCGKSMLGLAKVSSDIDPCEKAYDYFVIHKKIWEAAPGITSMLASSALAGLAQKAVTKTVLRVTGVDIALWLTPGGMEVKGLRLFLVKGLQIGTFVAIDGWLNRYVTAGWKNFFDGKEFFEMQKNLSYQVNILNQTQWRSGDDSLQIQLKEFHQKMSAWRTMNLAEVYEAHQNWSQALQQLTGMFNSSRAFYDQFIGEVRNARFTDSKLKLLQRVYPFNGIIAKDLAEDKQELYLTNPTFIESSQIETLVDAANKATEFMASAKGQDLKPQEKTQLTAIVSKLNGQNKETVISGLFDFLKTIDYTLHNSGISNSYKIILREMYITMGNPKPMMQPGRGYLTAYENSPTTIDSFKGVGFYRQVGAISTPNFTDYMVMQMLCGPEAEKQEKLIKNSSGFPFVFLPPTIRNPQDSFDICKNNQIPIAAGVVYNMPFTSSSNTTSTGALSYLTNETRSTIVGDSEKSNFDEWWNKNVDIQMQNAFAFYSRQYDSIVVNLIRKIYNDNRNPINAGPVANGTMAAAYQEEMVYLSMLENLILKPSQQYKEYKLDLAKILEKGPTHAALKEVELEFAKLDWLIRKIKIVKDGDKEVVQSTLENSDIDEQFKKIQSSLENVATLLNVGKSQNITATTQNSFKLNNHQRNLVITCLENLQALGAEIMMYGSMANAVSWDKIKNLKKVNEEQQKWNNEVQAQLAKMRSLMKQGGQP